VQSESFGVAHGRRSLDREGERCADQGDQFGEGSTP